MESSEENANRFKNQEEIKLEDNEGNSDEEDIQYPFQCGIPKGYIVKYQVELEHLQCPICYNILWKPEACSQDKCFSSFCGPCIDQWVNKDKPRENNNQNQQANSNNNQNQNGYQINEQRGVNSQLNLPHFSPRNDENSIFRVQNNQQNSENQGNNNVRSNQHHQQRQAISQQVHEYASFFEETQEDIEEENEFNIQDYISNNRQNPERQRIQNQSQPFQYNGSQQYNRNNNLNSSRRVFFHSENDDIQIQGSNSNDNNLFNQRNVNSQPPLYRQNERIINSSDSSSDIRNDFEVDLLDQSYLDQSVMHDDMEADDSYNQSYENDILDVQQPHIFQRIPMSKCPKCKREYKKTTIPVINSLLSTLKIKCIYHKNGCKDQLNYDFYEKHIQQCNFSKVQCKGCKKNYLKKDFQKHEQICEYIDENCPKCLTKLSRKQFKENHNQLECFQQQNQSLKKEVIKYQEKQKQQEQKLTKLEGYLNSAILGTPIQIKRFKFQTWFNQNYTFNQRSNQVQLTTQCYNDRRKRNDFLHFYLLTKIFTQGICSVSYKICLKQLTGNLLIGICNSLSMDSIDFIINTSGELKKKESTDSKYRFIRKTDFQFSQGHTINFTYYPFQQRYEVKNISNQKSFSFTQPEIEQLGDCFYSFFSLEKQNDCIKFL